MTPRPVVPAVSTTGQGGLLDVALDPQFETNKTIFWSYSEPRPGGNGTALARGEGVVPSGLKGGRNTFCSMLKKMISLERKPWLSAPPKATRRPP
jgi:glucose/arabinose dehydrogenase